jgi:superfamily II DNA or RNA helicase
MTLTINNSYSQIQGLNTQDMNKLRKLLSYDIAPTAAYFSKNHYNTRRYLIDNKGNFPTGLLDITKGFLAQNALKCVIKDVRVKPSPYIKTKFKFNHEPYKAQIDACDKAVTSHRGTISMPTGTGKSLVIALIIAKLKVKTLIVVPNLEIKKQLKYGLAEIFEDLSHITIENIDSSELDKPHKYDCIIIDEAHHTAASTYQKLNKKQWNNIYYRFFITATPFRNNKDENLLFEAIAGDVIYKLSYKKAIAEGYIVPVEAYYLEIPKQPTEAYTWQQVYKELVTEHDIRNQMISDLLTTLSISNVSTLCLVKEIKHGDKIASISNIPFANGQDDDTRVFISDFNSRRLSCLIGTSGILGEGVDTKPCEFVIIAGLGKAKSAFMQQVGRAVRRYKDKESAKVILIKDDSHKFTKAHYKEQCKILLDEYNVIPIKLDI